MLHALETQYIGWIRKEQEGTFCVVRQPFVYFTEATGLVLRVTKSTGPDLFPLPSTVCANSVLPENNRFPVRLSQYVFFKSRLHQLTTHAYNLRWFLTERLKLHREVTRGVSFLYPNLDSNNHGNLKKYKRFSRNSLNFFFLTQYLSLQYFTTKKTSDFQGNSEKIGDKQ